MPAADSQVRYTAKLILPLVLAELNSYFIPILQNDTYINAQTVCDLLVRIANRQVSVMH